MTSRGARSQCLLVDFHQERVVFLSSVVGFIFGTSRAPHLREFHGMVPGPFHGSRQIKRVAGMEVQTSHMVLDDFCQPSQPRAKNRSPACEGFHNAHWKAFIQCAWNNDEARALDGFDYLLTGQLSPKGDSRELSFAGLGLQR